MYATDLKREQEYASSLEQQPLLGKMIALQADGQPFLGLFLETEKNDRQNVAIILHDAGSYPNQQAVVYALRTQLPLHHWASLAVQMPIREREAEESDYYILFPEAHSRIQAALQYALQNGAKNIVLIGYGLGGLMASYSINLAAKGISGLATLSLPVPENALEEVQTLLFIKNIALPFLDVYAEFDLPTVINTAAARRLAGKENPVYRQIRVEGENHSFQQDPDQLVKRVYSWLNATIQQQ